MYLKLFLICCLALIPASEVFGFGRQEPQPAWNELSAGEESLLYGRLRLIGNEPFTQLVLTLIDDQEKLAVNASFVIMDSYHNELMAYQQHNIKLLAKILALPEGGLPGAIEVLELPEKIMTE
ncbi:hypothetical protein [Spirochaeta dissipatitropha]